MEYGLSFAAGIVVVLALREWYIRYSLSGPVVLKDITNFEKTKSNSSSPIVVYGGEVEKTVAALRKLPKTSYNTRLLTLKGIVNFLVKECDHLCQALAEDLGRPRFEALSYDIYTPRNEILHLINNLARLTAWKRVGFDWSLLTFPSNGAYLAPEPYGVVLILGTWNFPLMLSLVPLAGAIAAGNSVVLKLQWSGRSSATSRLILDRLPRYLPSDAPLKMLGPPRVDGASPPNRRSSSSPDDTFVQQQRRAADIAATQAILQCHFDLIFFTGSPSVGKIVATAAAKHLTPCVLELGGKNPVFVDSTNLHFAAKRIIWGRMLNAGQQCVAPDYVLCAGGYQVAEEFAQACKHYIHQAFGPDPQNSPDFGRLATTQDAERLDQWIQNLPSSARIIAGGFTDIQKRYIAPTVVLFPDTTSPKNEEHELLSEEIFGPILPILPVTNADAAISYINARPKPLSLYIFAKNQSIARSFLVNTSAGGITVNDTIFHVAHPNLPFGGVGTSGYGAYHGDATFSAFSHSKPILIKSTNFLRHIGFFVYPPWSDLKYTLITAFMAPGLLSSSLCRKNDNKNN
mmetsp:Transcript_6107/g.9076  ORF Transcript_6107/g.9076 Transcript_6107/m.9076 type:complete len:572 (-) Transcript_6107:794-2509(-)